MPYVFREDQLVLPKVAASAIAADTAVRNSASSANQVLTAASSITGGLAGIAIAAAASPGDPVAVQYDGVARCICAASVGPNQPVGVASSNGALGPLGASSGVERVGVSQVAAAAGEKFSVLLTIDKVGA